MVGAEFGGRGGKGLYLVLRALGNYGRFESRC